MGAIQMSSLLTCNRYLLYRNIYLSNFEGSCCILCIICFNVGLRWRNCSARWNVDWESKYNFPAGIYLLKVNNKNTRTRCEICSKLTIKTPERRQWRRSGVFIVNFKRISHLVLVFLLLTLNMQLPAGLL